MNNIYKVSFTQFNLTAIDSKGAYLNASLKSIEVHMKIRTHIRTSVHAAPELRYQWVPQVGRIFNCQDQEATLLSIG